MIIIYFHIDMKQYLRVLTLFQMMNSMGGLNGGGDFGGDEVGNKQGCFGMFNVHIFRVRKFKGFVEFNKMTCKHVSH